MQRRIRIQSFGDIITNSSSEVYTIYDRDGVKQIEEAINNIVKALNPNINIEDHITLELVPTDNYYGEDDAGNSINFDEYYKKEFDQYCLENSNEGILLGFSDWLADFENKTRIDDNGMPMWDLKITPITHLGEVLMDSIYRILYAFEHEEVYT